MFIIGGYFLCKAMPGEYEIDTCETLKTKLQ